MAWALVLLLVLSLWLVIWENLEVVTAFLINSYGLCRAEGVRLGNWMGEGVQSIRWIWDQLVEYFWLGEEGVDWVWAQLVEWFWLGKGGVDLALGHAADYALMAKGFVGLKFALWFG